MLGSDVMQTDRLMREEVMVPEILLFKKLGIRKSDSVLDVGCGNGFYTIQSLKAGANVFSIDRSMEKISASRSRANSDYSFADATMLPFKSRTFDKASCMSIIEHIKNQEQFVKEVGRVLKLGGKVIFYTPNKKNFMTLDWYREKLFPKYHARELQKHDHNPNLFIRPFNLKALLEKNGFVVDQVVYNNGLFHEIIFETLLGQGMEQTSQRTKAGTNGTNFNSLIKLYNTFVFPILFTITLLDKIPALFGISSDFAIIARKV
tara:strand:+ start:371 stop:1156 length:786 start_codon:yes stop_codon:yes gene_type:complete